MKKIILSLSIATTILLTSCTGSDDAPSTTDVLLKKTIITYEGDDESEIVNYAYNGNKIVSITSNDGYKQVFTYTGDLITKIENFDDNILEGTDTFEYNSNKQLVTFKSISIEQDFGIKEEYVHNADESISVTLYSGNSTSQTQLSSTSTIFFENGEIVRIENPDQTVEITYDTKNNPFRNVTGISKIVFADGGVIGTSHNITQINTGQDFIITTQYIYNTNNYPATSKELYNDVEESVTQYFY